MFEATNSTHFYFTVEGLEAISSDHAMAEDLDFEFTLKETYEKREYTTQTAFRNYNFTNMKIPEGSAEVKSSMRCQKSP